MWTQFPRVGARYLQALGGVICCLSVASAQQLKRPVTVADAIGMTKLADPSDPGEFSPDGGKFVVLLQRGNLNHNTNDYSLLLWRTGRVFLGSKPEILITMSSSSNRPAIKDVRWLNDNKTLVFLGEQPGETQQIYSLDAGTHALKRLTRSPTNIVSCSMDSRGERIFYAAERADTAIFDNKARREGLAVSTQAIVDLSSGHRDAADAVFYGEVQFFLQGHDGRPRKMHINLLSPVQFEPPVISPDGRYVVILAVVDSVPERWKGYSNPSVQWWAQRKRNPQPSGQRVLLLETILLDTFTDKIRPLLNAPTSTSAHTEVAWSPDSRSVAVTNSYLPLSEGFEKESERPVSAVEVSIPDNEIIEISREDLNSPKWLDTNRISFRRGKSKWQDPSSALIFEKSKSRWSRSGEESFGRNRPSIAQKEGLNSPPKIVAVDPKNGHSALLLDLNPQFADLQFANEVAIQWKGSDGHDVRGGLYYPVDYEPGRRYPLVIQTHAFRADEFWIDGPFSTAFAAQPLAGRGIMVLQMDEDTGESDTPREVDREVAGLEGAIDYLDRQGLIDRNRLGVIGFSRTCLHVKYALTHSNYHFAAASVTDGVDNGYFQYILCNNLTAFDEAFEGSNGALPFGEGLKSWLKRSPGFNIDKVSTPLFIFAPNRTSALFQWEWFAALKRLNKPVEMIVAVDDEHELRRPWNRRISLQGNVDWFCFWLKAEEDSDSTKAAQYARWRDLRKLQEQNNPPLSGDLPHHAQILR